MRLRTGLAVSASLVAVAAGCGGSSEHALTLAQVETSFADANITLTPGSFVESCAGFLRSSGLCKGKDIRRDMVLLTDENTLFGNDTNPAISGIVVWRTVAEARRYPAGPPPVSQVRVANVIVDYLPGRPQAPQVENAIAELRKLS